LIAIARDNRQSLQYGADARLSLAEVLLAAGNSGDAATQLSSACAAVNELLARDPTIQRWRMARRDCLMLQAQLALANGNRAAATIFANQAVSLSHRGRRQAEPRR
jgi:hypothetical protein